ncbi:hypothetical protein Tco_1485746 [Tanacetum coccineum]
MPGVDNLETVQKFWLIVALVVDSKKAFTLPFIMLLLELCALRRQKFLLYKLAALQLASDVVAVGVLCMAQVSKKYQASAIILGEDDGRNRCKAFVFTEVNKAMDVNVLTD